MGLFGKNKTNEELEKVKQECFTKICEYIKTSKDQNRLNMMFTEVTIFRMKYDKKDGLFQNLRDLRKRKQNIDKNNLIVSQIEDIFDSINKFDPNELDELNDLMKSVLPQEVKTSKNGWEQFWSDFWSNFDKGAGKSD